MPEHRPTSPEEVADILQSAASESQTIRTVGNNSKHLLAGKIPSAQTLVSTNRLNRILQYERADLTISVEAGVQFAQVQQVLAENGQMIALDPPFYSEATVGGVVASNSSGPMRRGYGTARDLVIGMTFAMLDGKLIKAGGMVVKNVAGLDVGKLMIGSYGTLGVITSLNFRVHTIPAETCTFLFTFGDLESAIEKRNSILRSVLQPTAIDLISPVAATRLNLRGYILAIRAGGSRAVLDRYKQELAGAEDLSGQSEATLWQQIREFTPDFLRRQPTGVVVRVSTTLNDVHPLLKLVSGAAISRAGSGVTYAYLTHWQGVATLWKAAAERGWSAVVECAPDEIRETKDLWLSSSSPNANESFGMMERVKDMFDPKRLLNPARLYGRI
jgi:glycolate oxidase FAD binding subunit